MPVTRFHLLVFTVVATVSIFFLTSCEQAMVTTPSLELTLHDQWFLQASGGVSLSGEQLTTEGSSWEGWYSTAVPRTVLAALVDNGVYKDPYFGKNLEQIPAEQFQQSWWYRTEFTLTEDQLREHARLTFEGINYRANVWLNGVSLGTTDSVLGAFRIFQLDVTGLVRTGVNRLAVEVFPPRPGDFTIGFVDWNPTPPDRNMGLWREVRLRFSGPVSIENPFVRTKVNLETLAQAELTLSADLINHSQQKVSGTLAAQLSGFEIRQDFSLEPLEKRTIALTPQQHPQLEIENPRLWWPNNLGEPHLYDLKLTVLAEETVSDARDVRFGIREVGDFLNEQGHRGYTVNGKQVLIRGGGWVDDLMLADSTEKIEAQMRYARHMNLNTIRLEGFWGSSQALYDLADQYGLLIMVGWSCQWEWEGYLGGPVDDFGGVITPEQIDLVSESLRDQVLWLRNHPSILVWVFGSDMLPRPALERKYGEYLGEIDTTRPVLAACSLRVSEISGPTAVKMNGPYDYVTPNYWYEDTRNGGAYGFNTETGPGPQPPPIDSIRRMIPEEHLWPIDDMWDYHCGRNEFNTMKRYLNALHQRYGEPQGLEDFLKTAQAANYEAIRAMFEAFGVNKFQSTGVIQWMLNSAWPETYWQLYDWYLMPNGAFYGTRKASQPLHLAYHYGDGSIHLVNDTLEDQKDLNALVRIFDLNSQEVFSERLPVSIEANTAKRIKELNDLTGLTPVYFLDLRLFRADQTVAANFYWLSLKPDVLDFANTLWFVTPNQSFADFTPLRNLPGVPLEAQANSKKDGDENVVRLTLSNPTDTLAFFVELKLVAGDSKEPILPVFWEDNYLSIPPHEEKTVEVRFNSRGVERPVVWVEGWNTSRLELNIE